jgi:DNA-directed RNA polymerase specialized sigma24 family protein
MGLAQDDAADVFQTVTIFLYQRLGSIRDRARLGAWLLTTAARETMRGVLVEKDLRDYCPPQAATT